MIYLDYNATTPLAPEVVKAITESLTVDWGNPSSDNEIGKRCKAEIDNARKYVSAMIGAKANEIVFTSGGTEANNMVIHTAIENFNKSVKAGIISTGKGPLPHVITTTVEHDTIKLPLQHFHSRREIEVTFVPVSKLTGHVEVAEILSALRSTTCLVTVMLANNETGALQPVAEIAAAVRNWEKQNNSNLQCSILLHTDAAQALGKVAVNVEELGVDYLTIVGHKFYGPRIGALFVRDIGISCPLYPLLFGGGQERGYRPGTENTPMIVGLGKAAQLVSQNLSHYTQHFLEMKNYLEERIRVTFGQDVRFNNSFQNAEHLPNTVNVSFIGDGLKGKKILSKCHKLRASVGAACHSKGGPSQILLACGVPEKLAANALRLSIGRETRKEDIDDVILDLHQATNLLKQESNNVVITFHNL